jgi:type II secretory pathway pseudopilin PulG
MIFNRTAVYLSAAVLAALLIHACQAEVVRDGRSVTAGGTAQPASANEQAKAGTSTPGTPATAASYTMSWDASTDPAIVSYKVFVVPPDRNPRFPGKTDVPIQIKNYPLATLQKNGTKYSVAVTGDEIKAVLGATVVNAAAYCFTVAAVNGVGNSAHSPVICP